MKQAKEGKIPKKKKCINTLPWIQTTIFSLQTYYKPVRYANQDSFSSFFTDKETEYQIGKI